MACVLFSEFVITGVTARPGWLNETSFCDGTGACNFETDVCTRAAGACTGKAGVCARKTSACDGKAGVCTGETDARTCGACAGDFSSAAERVDGFPPCSLTANRAVDGAVKRLETGTVEPFTSSRCTFPVGLNPALSGSTISADGCATTLDAGSSVVEFSGAGASCWVFAVSSVGCPTSITTFAGRKIESGTCGTLSCGALYCEALNCDVLCCGARNGSGVASGSAFLDAVP